MLWLGFPELLWLHAVTAITKTFLVKTAIVGLSTFVGRTLKTATADANNMIIFQTLNTNKANSLYILSGPWDSSSAVTSYFHSEEALKFPFVSPQVPNPPRSAGFVIEISAY